MAVHEKSGGEREIVLACGHGVRELGGSFGSHPSLGALYKCPRCKRVVPIAPKG